MSARRVVSLVPSITESLFLLGVGDRVVGRTDYCVEPMPAVATVPSVGGTKSADVDAIAALRPDLVLVNQEENTEAIDRDLRARGLRVHLSFPKTVAAAVALLHELADMFDVPADHPALVRLGDAVAAMERLRANTIPCKVFCPIWMDPLMTIHGDTFISDVLDLCGGQNVFLDRPRRYPLAADLGRAAAWSNDRVGLRDTRYPRVTLDEVVERQPELVLLPDEPHPFSEADAAVFRALPIPAAAQGRVLRVDGKALCWHSPRLADALPQVRAWLHPTLPPGSS